MIHDQDLVDRLAILPTERFEGDVFRATRVDADPTAPSISGGRWAPPPDDALAATVAAQRGSVLFDQVGCAKCHVRTLITAPAGISPGPGRPPPPAALAGKTFHPFSDFLLHDIGTGDGIPVLPLPEYASTANQMRTVPLWALRTRNRLMHDGLSLTKQDAVQRHAGQAADVTKNYNVLSAAEKNQLLAFLDSL